jgi:hypothetical protein
MKSIILATLALCTSFAWAATDGNDPIDCWDQSFAYTQTRVTSLGTDDRFYVITVESENQTLFPNLVSGPKEGWGLMKVKIVTASTNCVKDPSREDVMTCTDKRGSNLTIRYSESIESEKILTLDATEVTYKTQVVGEKFIVDLNYVAQSKTNPQGSLHLEFRLGPGAPKCTGFSQ